MEKTTSNRSASAPLESVSAGNARLLDSQSKPESTDNTAGDKTKRTLSPVGKALGLGFEKGAGPVGGVIKPIVGGIMRSGKGFGDTLGVGFGKAEGGSAKQQDEEHPKTKETLGGEESLTMLSRSKHLDSPESQAYRIPSVPLSSITRLQILLRVLCPSTAWGGRTGTHGMRRRRSGLHPASFSMRQRNLVKIPALMLPSISAELGQA